MASLVATAKLNGVEPLAWLTDVLERVVSGRTKAHELERLLPWNWKAVSVVCWHFVGRPMTMRIKDPKNGDGSCSYAHS